MSAARIPQYRADAKGQIAVLKRECADTMCGEISSADHFILRWDDCEHAVREYAPYLTDGELAGCFKAAMRSAA